MSTYSILDGQVEIYGVEVTQPQRIEGEIAKAQADVDMYKQRLSMLAACTPKDLFPSDNDGTTNEKLGWELDAIFEGYEEAVGRLHKLYVIDMNKDVLVDIYAPEPEKKSQE